jgi:preprotein translocase subunit SecF
MKFIKKNKFIFIISIIIVVIFLLSTISIINIFFPNLGVPLYGNRLANINDVKISKNRQTDIANNILKTEKVDKVSVDIRGNLINFIINCKNNVDVIGAKNIAIKVLDEFSTEEKDFYDIQFFMTNTTQDSDLFPVIGYKNKISSTIVWSRKN